jgi:ring-1,2-phenylacetyl-CoA epoxidase subunit PaaD
VVTRAGTEAGRTSSALVDRVRAVVADVPDPEVPVLTIADLGVLRDVRVEPDGRIVVDVTPTYSGCPAMDAIRSDIRHRLAEAGWPDAEVRTVLAPAWTTDWLSADGRRKLTEFGIAPPAPVAAGARPAGPASAGRGPVPLALSVRCPRCGSPDTVEVSRFGSTACKALWSCRSCLEPFDSFKAL